MIFGRGDNLFGALWTDEGLIVSTELVSARSFRLSSTLRTHVADSGGWAHLLFIFQDAGLIIILRRRLHVFYGNDRLS